MQETPRPTNDPQPTTYNLQLTTYHQQPTAPLDALSLLVWLCGQVGAIAICSANIQFTATWPADPRGEAVAVLLATQMILLSLAFPRLLRSVGSAALGVASGLPMIALAGKLSAAPLKVEASAAICLLGWTFALLPWAVWAKTGSRAGLAIAVLGLLMFGWPVLAYLKSEFGASNQPLSLALHPFAAIFSINYLHFLPLGFWLVLGLICGFGVIVVMLDKNRATSRTTK